MALLRATVDKAPRRVNTSYSERTTAAGGDQAARSRSCEVFLRRHSVYRRAARSLLGGCMLGRLVNAGRCQLVGRTVRVIIHTELFLRFLTRSSVRHQLEFIGGMVRHLETSVQFFDKMTMTNNTTAIFASCT